VVLLEGTGELKELIDLDPPFFRLQHSASTIIKYFIKSIQVAKYTK
jgi:hypothetical protein